MLCHHAVSSMTQLKLKRPLLCSVDAERVFDFGATKAERAIIEVVIEGVVCHSPCDVTRFPALQGIYG